MTRRLRILIAGHLISADGTGEGFIAFKLAEALAPLADVTVVTLQSPRHRPLAEQLPGAETVTFPLPRVLLKPRQFRELVKPEWLVFRHHLRRFLETGAERFDLGHQLMPAALRHTAAFHGTRLPYVIGPFGGSLPTPPAFLKEVRDSGPWFTRLRDLDTLRLRHDPWLRASHSGAAMVLGVAPYIKDTLERMRLPVRAYDNYMMLGIPDLPELPPKPLRGPQDEIRLLHVGRGIRTKGLRDLVRALALLRDDRRFHLEAAGGGEEVALCRTEAERLGVADRIIFHGLLPRETIEDLYRRADVFAFPSFREPAGAVFYEAMRWGLPTVTADAGGAALIVDDSCGLKVPVTDPGQYPRDIAAALLRLADDPALMARLSAGARARVAEALWPNRARELMTLYHRTLDMLPERRT